MGMNILLLEKEEFKRKVCCRAIKVHTVYLLQNANTK